MKIKSISQGAGPRRAINQSQKSLTKLLAQMASGKRINNASDDAAGLAIASRMTADLRGMGQAMRNVGDGISYVQTAEAGLAASTDALQRMRELAVQAGSGILNDSDRRAIQTEMDHLSAHLGDIADQTSFNGRRPLAGEGIRLQIGPDARDQIGVPGFDARPDQLGQGAIVEGGAIDANGVEAGELTINGVDIRATTAADDPDSTADAEGSAAAVAAAINDASEATGVTAEVIEAEVEGGDVAGGTLDADNALSINGEAITGFDVNAEDAGGALVDAINAQSEDTGVTASLSAQGRVILQANDGRNIQVETTGAADAITGLSAGTTSGSVRLESDEAIEIAGTAPGDTGFTAGLTTPTAASSVSRVDVSSVSNASQALESIDRALEQVGGHRSRLGAVANRLEATQSNLMSQQVHAAEARSRIEDLDYARASTEHAKQQILGQAGVAMLAQANISSQVVASLLSG